MSFNNRMWMYGAEDENILRCNDNASKTILRQQMSVLTAKIENLQFEYNLKSNEVNELKTIVESINAEKKILVGKIRALTSRLEEQDVLMSRLIEEKNALMREKEKAACMVISIEEYYSDKDPSPSYVEIHGDCNS
jgi:hypothetical protein